MDTRNIPYSIIVIIFLFCSVHQPCSGGIADCRIKNTCSDCMGVKGCSWCTQVNDGVIVSGALRAGCFPREDVMEVCAEENIDHTKSAAAIVRDEPLRGSLAGEPVQIRPQYVRLKLKPGERFTIGIQFRKAEDYPVDLYYLMDFSSSMSKYKRSLSELGDKLTETMKNVTSNFQIGFGSFVDKVALPFTDTIPSHLEKPCTKCRPPYSFINHMALSRETKTFSGEVRRARMSGNNDTPEGVLDALMQAMVCRKKLNWREKARHILVVSTDAPFHLAGDGKLGGIVEPHDGECHLDERGEYTHALVLDYPSVSQINQKALENNVNIIFAVVHKVKEEYNSLAKEIHGASIGLLDRGENVAEIIKSQYEKLSTTIQLKDDAKGSVHVSYSALCPNHRARADETWFDTNECRGIKSGGVVEFEAHLTALDCSEKQIITIKPVGMNESLTVELETICDCDCARMDHPGVQLRSPKCSGVGDLICGKCSCPEGKVGETCECDGSDASDVTDTKSCLATNSTTHVCSGRGECICGVCRCDKRENPNEEISGQYCECDNYSCDRRNGLLCSGHGSCHCKKCSCQPGWSGNACDCTLDESPCRAEGEGEVCSGRGKCICGTCRCQNGTNPDEYRYTGKYCQTCMTCGQQCELYNDCVECLAYNTGLYSEANCQNCSEKFTFFDLTDDAKGLHENLTSSTLCISADKAGCSFRYVYDYSYEEEVMVWAESEKVCPKELNLIAIISGTTGGTVLIGLLFLLAWKLLTTIHDRREYEKFERERASARWGRGENPLYRMAIQSYKNPTYNIDKCN